LYCVSYVSFISSVLDLSWLLASVASVAFVCGVVLLSLLLLCRACPLCDLGRQSPHCPRVATQLLPSSLFDLTFRLRFFAPLLNLFCLVGRLFCCLVLVWLLAVKTGRLVAGRSHGLAALQRVPLERSSVALCRTARGAREQQSLPTWFVCLACGSEEKLPL